MDLIAFLGAIAGGILINLTASELFAWGPRLSELLLHRAVQRLAPEMQDRMHEEWTGHLSAIPPGCGGSWQRRGLCWPLIRSMSRCGFGNGRRGGNPSSARPW
jgi:hypothetical protein